METFYLVNGWSDKLIEKVEVIRTTEKFVVREVWGKERKEKKDGNFFFTWEEARDFLLTQENAKLTAYRAFVQEIEDKINKIVALSKEDL